MELFLWIGCPYMMIPTFSAFAVFFLFWWPFAYTNLICFSFFKRYLLKKVYVAFNTQQRARTIFKLRINVLTLIKRLKLSASVSKLGSGSRWVCFYCWNVQGGKSIMIYGYYSNKLKITDPMRYVDVLYAGHWCLVVSRSFAARTSQDLLGLYVHDLVCQPFSNTDEAVGYR